MTLPLPEPLDPRNAPPLDRYCDLVLEGGVINGVVYPGFLMEIARKYRFASIGGTSVGAIAAALAVACEYSRRYGRDTGFNEGLRKLPETLGEYIDSKAQTTRIRSLFQPAPQVKRLFDFGVEFFGKRIKRKKGVYGLEQNKGEMPERTKSNLCGAIFDWLGIFYKHFLFSTCDLIWWGIFFALVSITSSSPHWIHRTSFFLLLLIFLPAKNFGKQLHALLKMQGFGMCSGKSVDGKQQALIEWLHEGIQKAAGLTYASPLTFNDIWNAPGGPVGADGNSREHSIEFRTVTSCLSHGRIYELPIQDPTARVFFKLSEFKNFFPDDVIRHLRKVAKPLNFDFDLLTQRYADRTRELRHQATPDYKKLHQLKILQRRVRRQLKQKEKFDLHSVDIRELPVGDLPILVAARLSFSVPVLFQAVPLLGFNLDMPPENMGLVRLWFSDGGLGSNLPVSLFDKALPRWPTFAVNIVETAPKRPNAAGEYRSFVPYFHKNNIDDRLIVPTDPSGFTQPLQQLNWRSFAKFIFGLYTTTKDGSDRASLRMPNVRNRVVSIYTNNIVGGALNLMISQAAIRQLGCGYGVNAGKNIANAYLGQVPLERHSDVSLWTDHRWVRFNILVKSLRQYLTGFNLAAQSSAGCDTLINQINKAVQKAPLRSKNSDEPVLTDAQAEQLKKVVSAIQNLELELNQLNHPIPYLPLPETELRIKPKV